MQEKIERLPVEPRFGDAQELAFGIVEADVAERRPVVDRSFDPAYADLETALGGEPFDAVDDKTAARAAVEDHRRQCDHGDNADQENRQPFSDPAEPRSA